MAATAGLIGFGAIGRVHATALADVGVSLVGVACASPGAGERAAAELGVQAFASADALIADDAVAVVHVCTPHHLHESLARAALRAGKHVVCEKPLALDGAAAWALADEAERSGRVHAVCYHQRFAEGIPELRRAVAHGELGVLHLVHGAFLLDEVAALPAGHWMLDAARAGPSLTLADVGVHWWDLLEHVSGERIEAVAAATRSVHAGGRDDSAVICLRLTGGIQAVAGLSQAVGTPARLTLELCGTAAVRAWAGVEGAPAAAAADAQRRAFAALLRAVYADIEAGRLSPTADYATFRDGARGVAVLDALLAAAASRRWRRVVSPGPPRRAPQ